MRWLVVIVPAGLVALGLSSAPATAAHAVPQQTVPQQSGHFWPGNLLSMDNADFENGTGDWKVTSNVSALTTDTTAFLHSHALKIVASGTPPITSTLQLAGTNGIQINLNGDGTSRTYRVGAYVEMPPTSGHTTEFDLACYDSSGKWLGWSDGSPVSNNSTGGWQWVEDDVQVPPACAYVRGSPRVRFTGMHKGGTIHMDEVWFAPYRAALMIGAYAPDAPTWQTDNTPGTSTYIGPLQSDKIFFGGNSPPLPGQWNDPSNRCYEIMQSPNPPAEPPACVVNLNPPSSPSGPVYTEAQIQAFFTGMPAGQTVIMVYHGEAENTGKGTFSGCPGSGDAAKFVSCFEQEANNIRTAAAAHPGLTENVFTADDSASSQYDASGTGHGCSWIVPPNYADFYVEDHYERGWANGSNLSVQSGSSKAAPQWNSWLSCVDGSGKPIGLAEYGLCSGGADCNHGSTTCGDAGSTTDDAKTMTADNTYLAGEPSGTSPTLLWEYWYDKCWQFGNGHGGMTEWRSIENQNGGAVGG
jgi:hypothetical protein